MQAANESAQGKSSEDWSSDGRGSRDESYVDPQPPSQTSDSAYLGLLVPIGRSAWAIVAGYLGLACVLLYPSPLAILAGVLAIRDIRANPRKRGLVRAWFGIIAGLLGTVGLVMWTQR